MINDDSINGICRADNQLHEIVNYMPGGMHICYLSEPVHLEYSSEGLCRMLGYSREEFERITQQNYDMHLLPEDRQKFSEFARSLADNPGIKTLIYRMKRKDGSVIYVSDTMKARVDSDGVVRGYSSVTDITALKEAENEILMQREKYKKLYTELKISHENLQLISTVSGLMFFEYDVKTHTFISFENSDSLLGASADELLKRLEEQKAKYDGDNYTGCPYFLLHPDDKAVWMAADAERDNYSDEFYAEVRLLHKDGKYHWFAIRKRFLTDENGENAIEIGCVWNIDKSRQEVSNLRHRAEIDPMTNLYNKPSAYAMIERTLSDEPNQTHVLLFIDIDNFKQINDTFGHEIGDEAICFVADAMRLKFRSYDILARFGGDEFIAFLPNVMSRKAIEEKARNLCGIVSGFEGFGNAGIRLSVSIGIAFSNGEKTAQELCEKSDAALYRVKAHGKGKTAVYSAE